MLAFQIQQFPFRLGLAEGVEPHQAPPGTLTTAENVVWRKGGKLEKRYGTTQIANSIVGGGSISAGARLFTRGLDLCLIDRSSLYAYSPSSAAWRSVGTVPTVAPTWSTIVDATGGVSASDVAVYGNYIIHAWVTGDPTSSSTVGGGRVFVQVFDSSTNTVVVAPTQLSTTATATYSGVRVLVVDSTAIVLSRANTGTPFKIRGGKVNMSTLATTAMADVTAGADLATNQGFAGWDACVIGSTFVVAYNRTGAILALESYNASFVSQASGTISGEASGCSMVSIDGAAGEVLYVLYSQGVATPTPARIAIANSSTLAQTVAPVTIETPAAGSAAIFVGVCRFDSTNCVASYLMALGDGTFRTTSWKVSSAALVSSLSQRGTWLTLPTSKPFMLNGRCYMMLVDYIGAQKNAFIGLNTTLVEVETSSIGAASAYVPHRPVGAIDLLLGGRVTSGGPLPHFVAAATGAMVGSATFQASAPIAMTTWRQGARMVTVATGGTLPSDMWRACTVSPEGYYIAGALMAYDGALTFDYGFARAPLIAGASTSAAGGSIAAGTYLYGAYEEFRSAVGVLHRSATATAAGLTTTGATSSNTLQVSNYNLSSKQTLTTGFGSSAATTTSLPIYRTVVGGSTYQRLSYEPGFNVVTVDESVNFQTFVDTRADASIDGAGTTLASRPAIYTTGGILDDYAPPAGVTMFHHADRLWVLAGDQKTWWYSKAFQDDLGTAPGFHPSFRIVFDDTQVAGASMDDKAIFFSATGVRYMLGTGPAPNGLNSDFQTPTIIQSDVGCTSARSVVSMPDGIMFLSDRGIYLLTRGLELVWIGRGVKDQLATYPTVTSAVLVAKQNQVRFTCTDAGGTIGITLVYDYVEKQWSTFKHWVGGAYGGPIADACMWNGAWTFVSAAGVVYSEDSTSYLDASSSYYVPMTLETSWINASGPLAFQSVREFALRGQSYTDHDLTIQVGFDSDASYPQSATFLAQSAVTAVGVEECNVTIGTRRKCQSIRFKITDATPTTGTLGTGRGPAFDVMGLEVGMKRGLATNPAAKRA